MLEEKRRTVVGRRGSWVGLVAFLLVLAFVLGLAEVRARQNLSWRVDDLLVNGANYARETTTPGDRKFQTSDDQRILVLGDSFVWGDGVELKASTWPGQLRTRLSTLGDVEVVDWGLNGAPTFSYLDWISENPDVYDAASLVVIGFVSNDPVPRDLFQCRDYWCQGILQFENSSEWRECQSGALLPQGSIARGLLRLGFPGLASGVVSRSCSLLAERLQSPETGFPYSSWLGELYEEESLEQFRLMIRELKRLDTDGKIVFLPTPISIEDFDLSLPALLILEEEGIPVIRMEHTLNLLAESGGYWGVSPVNSHPGAKIAGAYVEDLVSWLTLSSVVSLEAIASGSGGNTTAEVSKDVSGLPANFRVTRTGSHEYRFIWDDEDVSSLQVAGLPAISRAAPCERIGEPYFVADFSMDDFPGPAKVSGEFLPENGLNVYLEDTTGRLTRVGLASNDSALVVPSLSRSALIFSLPGETCGLRPVEIPNFSITVQVGR